MYPGATRSKNAFAEAAGYVAMRLLDFLIPTTCLPNLGC